MLMRSTEALRGYPPRLTDCLGHWAAAAPERTCAARREAGGDWRRVSYAAMLRDVRDFTASFVSGLTSAIEWIIRWKDEGDFDGVRFQWNHLVLAGDPANSRPEARGRARPAPKAARRL